MQAIIAQAVRYMSKDNKRRPIAIAKDMSEFLYLHLLRAITTVAWQSSGRCKKEEIVLSSVSLFVSDALSLSAGGRSTRLVEVVLRSYSNCSLYPEVTLVVLQTQKFFLSGNHKQHRQGMFSFMSFLLCVTHHNRHEQNFSKFKLCLNAMCTSWMKGSYCTCVT